MYTAQSRGPHEWSKYLHLLVWLVKHRASENCTWDQCGTVDKNLSHVQCIRESLFGTRNFLIGKFNCQHIPVCTNFNFQNRLKQQMHRENSYAKINPASPMCRALAPHHEEQKSCNPDKGHKHKWTKFLFKNSIQKSTQTNSNAIFKSSCNAYLIYMFLVVLALLKIKKHQLNE